LHGREAAGQRRQAVEAGRRAERPTDRLGRLQRGDRARRRLDGEQVGETPGAARQQRRNLDQSVVAPGYYGDAACFPRGPRRSSRLCLSEIRNSW
jgi:hypothetical protein